MKLPQVGDRLRVLRKPVSGIYTIGHIYTVSQVEYPDRYGCEWFYLIGDDGDEHPFRQLEIDKYVEFVTPTPDSPLWSL